MEQIDQICSNSSKKQELLTELGKMKNFFEFKKCLKEYLTTQTKSSQVVIAQLKEAQLEKLELQNSLKLADHKSAMAQAALDNLQRERDQLVAQAERQLLDSRQESQTASERLAERIAELERQVSLAQGEVADLAGVIRRKDQYILEQDRQWTQLQAKFSALQSENADLQIAVESNRLNSSAALGHSQLESFYAEQVKTLQQQLLDKNAELVQLNSACNQYKQKLALQTTDFDQQKLLLNTEVDTVRLRHSELLTKFNQLTADFGQLEKFHQHQTRELTSNTDNLLQLSAKLEEDKLALTKKCENLKKITDRQQTEIEEITAENRQLLADIEQNKLILTKEIDNLQIKIDALENSRKRAGNASVSSVSLLVECEEMKREADKLTLENIDLKSKLSELMTNIENKSASIKTHEANLSRAEQFVESMIDASTANKVEIAELTRKNAEFVDKVKTLSADVKNKDMVIRDLSKQIQILVEKNSLTPDKIMVSASAQIAKNKDNNDFISKNFVEFTSVSELQDQNMRLIGALRSLSDKTDEEICEKLSKLKNENVDLSAKVEQLQLSNMHLNERVKFLNNLNNTMKEKTLANFTLDNNFVNSIDEHFVSNLNMNVNMNEVSLVQKAFESQNTELVKKVEKLTEEIDILKEKNLLLTNSSDSLKLVLEQTKEMLKSEKNELVNYKNLYETNLKEYNVMSNQIISLKTELDLIKENNQLLTIQCKSYKNVANSFDNLQMSLEKMKSTLELRSNIDVSAINDKMDMLQRELVSSINNSYTLNTSMNLNNLNNLNDLNASVNKPEQHPNLSLSTNEIIQKSKINLEEDRKKFFKVAYDAECELKTFKDKAIGLVKDLEERFNYEMEQKDKMLEELQRTVNNMHTENNVEALQERLNEINDQHNKKGFMQEQLIGELQDKVKKLKELNNNLRERYDSELTNHAQDVKQVNETNKLLKQHQRNVQVFNEQVEKLTGENQQLRNTLKEYDVKLNDLIVNRQETDLLLEQQNTTLTNQLTQITNQINSFIDSNLSDGVSDRLREILNSCDGQNLEVSNNLGNNGLNDVINFMKREKEILQSKLNFLSSELRQEKLKVEYLEKIKVARGGKSMEEEEVLIKEISKLTSENEEKTNSLENLTRENVNLKKKIDEIQSEKEIEENKVSRIKEVAQQRLLKMKGDYEEKIRFLREQTESNDESKLQEIKNKYEEQIASFEGEIENMKKKLLDMENDNKTLIRKNLQILKGMELLKTKLKNQKEKMSLQAEKLGLSTTKKRPKPPTLPPTIVPSENNQQQTIKKSPSPPQFHIQQLHPEIQLPQPKPLSGPDRLPHMNPIQPTHFYSNMMQSTPMLPRMMGFPPDFQTIKPLEYPPSATKMNFNKSIINQPKSDDVSKNNTELNLSSTGLLSYAARKAAGLKRNFKLLNNPNNEQEEEEVAKDPRLRPHLRPPGTAIAAATAQLNEAANNSDTNEAADNEEKKKIKPIVFGDNQEKK